jgi:hypothetical protein
LEFSGASLFGGFGSLIDRFNSLFGRLGNLPARGPDSNGLQALGQPSGRLGTGF